MAFFLDGAKLAQFKAQTLRVSDGRRSEKLSHVRSEVIPATSRKVDHPLRKNQFRVRLRREKQAVLRENGNFVLAMNEQTKGGAIVQIGNVVVLMQEQFQE